MSSTSQIAQLTGVIDRAQKKIDFLSARNNQLADFLDGTENLNMMNPEEIIAKWEAFKAAR